MKDKLTIFTKGLLDFMFYTGMLTIVLVPFIIRIYGKYNSYFGEHIWQLSILFMVSGVFAVLIINELRKMFRSVLADDCFIHRNVVSLKRMGNYSFCIALITCCRLFLYPTPAVLVVILVFVIAGLFSKVLAQVFDRAIAYKEENDLTI